MPQAGAWLGTDVEDRDVLSRIMYGAGRTIGISVAATVLAYVLGVQRAEIRRDLASVKHQDLAGSNVGDDHKEYFLGEKALLAGGTANTMNQF